MHHDNFSRQGGGQGSSGGIGSNGQATLADVAAVARVSQMTASRVLNDGPASDKARQAVLNAVEELGYRPNEAARALASKRRCRRSPAARQSGATPVSLQDLWSPYGKLISEMWKPRS